MNLYSVTWENVSKTTPVHVLKTEEKTLPTYVLASSHNNAVETALKHSTSNFQLKRVVLLTENVVITEEQI